MPAWKAPSALQATPLERPASSNLQAAEVVPEVVGRGVVGDEQIDQSIVVDVGRDDAEPSAVLVDDAGLGCHIDESAAVVAEQVVGQGGEGVRRAVVVTLLGVVELRLA